MEIFLFNFEDKKSKIENNKKQKEYSRFFVDYILKNFYKIDDKLKKEKSGKPYLLNNSFKISISHSNNLVAVVFDYDAVGLDIEFVKKRNYKKILEYFEIENNFNLEEFYQWWTVYEAEYKSKIKKEITSFRYKNFICTISSENKFSNKVFEINYKENEQIEFNELVIKEFYLPLNIKNTAKTINKNPTA